MGPADRNVVILITSGLLVAAAVATIGHGAAVVARRAGHRLLAPVRPQAWRWSAFDVLLLFFTLFFLDAMSVSIAMTPPVSSWLLGSGDASMLSIPSREVLTAALGATAAESAHEHRDAVLQFLQVLCRFAVVALLLGVVMIRRSYDPRSPRRAWVRTGPKLAAHLALACLTWLVLTPFVFGVFALATMVFSSLGIESDAHPLTLFRREGSPVRAGLFLVSVTVLTPLAEELIFRGTMLVWAARERIRSQILIVVAGLFAAGTAKPGSVLWPVWFWCLGVALHTFAQWRCRDDPGARARLAAITSTSLVFACAHSAVWPTPIPLFVLGLGLGWLTLRTGSIAAPTVVHGAFNLVSAIVVLRGGAG